MNSLKQPIMLASRISIATSGLPTSLQIRLRSEIEDHYANLIEKQIEE